MSRTHSHKLNSRDFNNPLSDFKKVKKRVRKAKERQAMKDEDYENVPKFKNTDKYDFN